MTESFVVVTGNQKKLQEIKDILKDCKVEIQNSEIDLPEMQGNCEDIITAKAKFAANLLRCTVLVDDTSLEFSALGGMPGPYIKWFLEKVGAHGLFKMLQGFEDKNAIYRCWFALCAPDKEPVLFNGKMDGTIVFPRGENGFGFDACFLPNNSEKTLAEMTFAEKNTISSRVSLLSFITGFFLTIS